MKIPGSIRSLYTSKVDHYTNLKVKVDTIIICKKNSRWHYESRVKEEQAFTLKLESGRFKYPDIFEDFFACTIVVENQNQINNAIRFIKDTCNFKTEYRRPKSEGFTHKQSNSFPFDDLRLYVVWKDNPNLRPSGLDGTIFEVQIKTYLQHAWSIATHDLIYKGDNVTWPMERISFQVKAMLEHAEVSISQAEELSKCSSINKKNMTTKKRILAIKLIKTFWEQNQLPKNIQILADNIISFISAIGMSFPELKKLLEEEATKGRGPKIRNLSPFGSIVQSVFDKKPETIRTFLNKKK